jgi:hypothetical protein
MAGAERQWSAEAVHRSLLKLYVVFWLGVVLHLHGVMHGEVWPEGPMVRVAAAVPPIIPIVFVAWGKAGAAFCTILVTLGAGALWFLAVRKPREDSWRVLARVAIVIYWVVLWFPLALGA